MTQLSDQQLKQLIDTLPNQWFTQSVDVLNALEHQAQNQSSNALLHEYLAKYFHLAGDYEKAAFYAVHSDKQMNLDNKSLFSSAIIQTLLDYYIYKNAGSMDGASVQQSGLTSLSLQFGSATASGNIQNVSGGTSAWTRSIVGQSGQLARLNQQKPFTLLSQLKDQSKIQKIVDEVISRSSSESIVTFKVHTNQLSKEEIPTLSTSQLEVLQTDLMSIPDLEYRNKLLQALTHNYLEQEKYNFAIKYAVQVRDDYQFQFDFLAKLISAGKDLVAVQTAFCYYENLPSYILTEVQFLFRTLPEDQKSPLTQLIAEEILSGNLTTNISADFISSQQHIDKKTVLQLKDQVKSAEQICQCFLMHSLMSIGTQQYQHNNNYNNDLQKYQLLEFYSMIGLIFRGDSSSPQVYRDILGQVGKASEYQVGGTLIGMSYQFLGSASDNGQVLAELLSLFEQLPALPAIQRPPILHGLALATGLLCLGRGDEQVTYEYMIPSLSDDPVANYGILVGLGLANLGRIDIFEEENFKDAILPLLQSESEKVRHGAAICIGLMCFRQESRAEAAISLLENYSASNFSQFADSVEFHAPFALGLAYFSTGNVLVTERLLHMSNRFVRTIGARYAIQAIGLVLSGTVTATEPQLQNPQGPTPDITPVKKIDKNEKDDKGDKNEKLDKTGEKSSATPVPNDVAQTQHSQQDQQQNNQLSASSFSAAGRAFSLFSMCSKFFDAQVRAGACLALGLVFAGRGDERVVELLVKMMADPEELVRYHAIIAQSLVLQSICGIELPEAQKTEDNPPIGDRQKNYIYKVDYSDEEWERVRNQQKLYHTPGTLQERYRENYKMSKQRRLTLQEYVTQFRRDLSRVDKASLLTSRAQLLALGIMNAGGLNMQLRVRTDLQAASWAIFSVSNLWFPFQPIIGLCMEPQYIATVKLENNEICKVQTLFKAKKEVYNKHAYSVFDREVQSNTMSKFIQKARLSQQELKDTEKTTQRFRFMHELRNIAVDEFVSQANNARLSDIISAQEGTAPTEATADDPEDEFIVFQSPARATEEMTLHIELMDAVSVFGGVAKCGVLVVEELPDE